MNNFRQLSVIFGESWAVKNFLPQMFLLSSDPNYLFRLTPLFGILSVVDLISPETIKKMMLPVLQQMQRDPVPNIRLNVARTIQVMLPHV